MADLLGIAVTYDVEFIRCKELSDEIRKVLGIKKFEQYLTEPVSHYVSVFESATTTVRIRHEFSGCLDPKDNYLFDLAIQTKAKYIVSGDRDVCETLVGKPVEIVTLAKFKERLKQSLN